MQHVLDLPSQLKLNRLEKEDFQSWMGDIMIQIMKNRNAGSTPPGLKDFFLSDPLYTPSSYYSLSRNQGTCAEAVAELHFGKVRKALKTAQDLPPP